MSELFCVYCVPGIDRNALHMFLFNIHYNLVGIDHHSPRFINVMKELLPDHTVSCLRYDPSGLFTEPRFREIKKNEV